MFSQLCPDELAHISHFLPDPHCFELTCTTCHQAMQSVWPLRWESCYPHHHLTQLRFSGMADYSEKFVQVQIEHPTLNAYKMCYYYVLHERKETEIRTKNIREWMASLDRADDIYLNPVLQGTVETSMLGRIQGFVGKLFGWILGS